MSVCGKQTRDCWLMCTLQKGHFGMHHDGVEDHWFLEHMTPWHYPDQKGISLTGQTVIDGGHSTRECKQRKCVLR